MRTRFLLLWVAAFVLLAALMVAPGAPTVHAVSGGVVISAVYGGGGNVGSPDWSHDYVELFNRGSTPVTVNGWSLQYGASAQDTWNNKTDLPNVTIQPGQYFLVQEAAGAGGGTGAPLPTPDLANTEDPHQLASVSHKVALFSTTTLFDGGADPTGSPDLVDFVGYGTSNAYEGVGPAPSLSNDLQAVRAGNGCQDTDENSADFAAVDEFTPRNTASAVFLCGSDGTIVSTPTITAGDNVTITVNDLDLAEPSITVSATSSQGENETLTLNPTVNPGEYTGTFTVVDALPTPSNGTLEATSGTLTFTYIDALDSIGVVDTSRTDTTTVEPSIEVGSDGTIESTPAITAGEDVTVTVNDLDLAGPSITVSATSSQAENETLTLNTTGNPGEYSGTFTVVDTAPTAGNGTLEATSGTLTFTYIDALDSVGGIDTPRTDTTTVSAVVGGPGAFNLISPINGQLLRDGNAMLEWSLSSNASTFDVLLVQLTTDARLEQLFLVNVNAVDVCAATCTLDVTSYTATLIEGDYSWTVVAKDTTDVEATNGPGFFTVDVPPIELLSNGDFELDADDDKVPDGWTLKNASKDKLKCNKPDKTASNTGECAFKFKGGADEKAKLQQDVVTGGIPFAIGDTLTLSAYFNGNNTAVKAKVVLKVKYVGVDDPEKVNTVVGPSEGYSLVTLDALTLNSADLSQIKVMIKHKSTAGKLWIDTASLILDEGSGGGGVRGSVLPVPPAPDGFRGGN